MFQKIYNNILAPPGCNFPPPSLLMAKLNINIYIKSTSCQQVITLKTRNILLLNSYNTQNSKYTVTE